MHPRLTCRASLLRRVAWRGTDDYAWAAKRLGSFGVKVTALVGGVVLRAIYPNYLGRAPEGLPVGEPAPVIRGRASVTVSDSRH